MAKLYALSFGHSIVSCQNVQEFQRAVMIIFFIDSYITHNYYDYHFTHLHVE